MSYKDAHPFQFLTMRVEIDKEIFYIIKWLNSLSKTRTIYCCQKQSNDEAYVSVVCKSTSSLVNIIRTLEYVTILHEHEPEWPKDLFRLSWKSQWNKRFNERCKLLLRKKTG